MKISNLAVTASFLLFAAACNNGSNTSATDTTTSTMSSDTSSMMMMNDTSAMNMNKPMQMCVIMKDDKLMVMDNGTTSAMDKDMTMDDGTKVMTDGHYMKPGGEKIKMKNGDCIMKDGSVTTIDKMGM
jgi:hypothetical protein